MSEPCPCGLDKDYITCCGRFIEQHELPSTPTDLMRSRYTAYVKHNMDYILSTMKGPALKQFDKENSSIQSTKVKWQRLNVVREKMKSQLHAFVTFEAYYLIDGVERILCEKSEFKKIKQRWYYIDGKIVKPNIS